MRGKLIVVEGTDSSGKKTQVGLLEKRLKADGKKVEAMGFPAYNTKLGGLVGRYLAGEFGSKEEVGPEVGSMFFMMDRYQFKDRIRKTLEAGTTILMDRYTTGNIHQAALAEGTEQLDFWEWIKKVDSRLPRADFMVFLNVPAEVSATLFEKRDVKNVLVGKEKDILEKDREYQEKTRRLYLEIAKKEGWIIIECCKDGRLRPPEDIHEEILRKLKEKGAF